MILPTKHIPLNQSLLGAGAAMLEHLDRPCTPIAIWDWAKTSPDIGTYERFILIMDFLYAIGVIELADGLIKKRSQS